MISIRVEPHCFDAGQEIASLTAHGVGAIASFVGVVRGTGGLLAMTLEHYPAMTMRSLEALAAEAATRWDLNRITMIHRVGRLAPGDPIVFVGTASAHRQAALDACAFLIDRLKTDAPFWKCESFEDGRDQWVDARETDAIAALRWT